MTQLDRALKLVRKSECELRDLVVAAATAGEYSSVVHLAEWARRLSQIGAEAEAQLRTMGGPTPGASVRANEDRMESAPARKSPPRAKMSYPRFFKQGSRLVRVAWSKSEKAEYEHKAPLTVLKALATVIRECGRDGKVFSSEALFPFLDEDGGEVPEYQVYAALALLKQVGLVEQHGRKGYSVARPVQLPGEVEAVIRNLPEK